MQTSISDILKEYAEGRKVLVHYSKEKNITPVLRGYIVHCLVDFYMEQFNAINSTQFEYISEKIVETFQDEDKVYKMNFVYFYKH